ncbi:MAG TPA: DUF1272 domain-containing protein [Gammaproteobacteria bacterium]|nr:DUF1272 domain-containing protein [Gammaproteobacteria bacterium]
MLELRTSCEYCNRPLPPDSPDAWIRSYECTFCGHHLTNTAGAAISPPRKTEKLGPEHSFADTYYARS